MTTFPSRRTESTVVERISRFLLMSAIFDYNSLACLPRLPAHELLLRKGKLGQPS
jgi:hypothetical protein